MKFRIERIFAPPPDEEVISFLALSNEHEMSLPTVKLQALDTLRRNGAVWTFSVDQFPAGYAYANILPSEYGTLVCLIHEAYIDSAFVTHGGAKVVDQEIEDWARSKGATEMAFYTRRNVKAFKKRLLPGWELDSYVLKRKLSNE